MLDWKLVISFGSIGSSSSQKANSSRTTRLRHHQASHTLLFPNHTQEHPRLGAQSHHAFPRERRERQPAIRAGRFVVQDLEVRGDLGRVAAHIGATTRGVRDARGVAESVHNHKRDTRDYSLVIPSTQTTTTTTLTTSLSLSLFLTYTKIYYSETTNFSSLDTRFYTQIKTTPTFFFLTLNRNS